MRVWNMPPKVLIVLVIVNIVDNYESLKHASKSTNSISNSNYSW